MLEPKEFLYFYRILNWKNKISGIRPIGYTIFGYLMAGNFDFLPIFLNTLAIIGALIFCYGMNDYFDWKLQKEENFLSFKLKRKEISEKEALVYYFFSLFFLIPFFFFVRFLTMIIFLVGFFLIFFYSVNPLRLKNVKFLGFVLPPLAVFLLFLEGYSVLATFSLDIILLAVLIFIFQCYLEALHTLNDFFTKKEIKKIKNIKTIEKLIEKIPLISAFLSFLFSFLNPFFLVTFFASLLRFFAIKKTNIKKEIFQLRRKLFSLQWFLYEFLIYGILGVFHLF